MARAEHADPADEFRPPPRRPVPHHPVGLMLLTVLVPAVIVGIVLSLARHERGEELPWWMGWVGGRGQEPLARSRPEERVIRTLRLAGIEQASVGSRGRRVVVRVQVPEVRSAADVEHTWQTAAAAAVESYWYSGEVVVQVFDRQSALLEAVFDARSVRDAVQRDDARLLRQDGRFEFLPPPGDVLAVRPQAEPSCDSDAATRLRSQQPLQAAALPANAFCAGVDLTGPYLDEKNRVCGLLDEGGTRGAAAKRLRRDWESGSRGPGSPAADTRELVERLSRPGERPGGSAALLEDVEAAATSPAPPGQRRRLRVWLDVVRAVQGDAGGESVLADTARVVRAVRDAGVPRLGRSAEAVLVAAGDESSPSHMSVLRRFQVDSAGNTDGRPGDEELPNRAIASAPGGLTYSSRAGEKEVSAETWYAYRRYDGRMYWLAGEDGDVALTDASTTGWGWSHQRAALVSAGDVGRVLAVYDLE